MNIRLARKLTKSKETEKTHCLHVFAFINDKIKMTAGSEKKDINSSKMKEERGRGWVSHTTTRLSCRCKLSHLTKIFRPCFYFADCEDIWQTLPQHILKAGCLTADISPSPKAGATRVPQLCSACKVRLPSDRKPSYAGLWESNKCCIL